MSVDLCYCGIVEPTDEFHKKYTAFKACQDAGIEPPQALWDYFDGDEPNPSGLAVQIDAREFEDGSYGYIHEIDLTKLRPDITKIQIWMSY